MCLRFLTLLTAALLCAPACDDNTTTTATTPTTTITEPPFADTLTVNGSRMKQFSTTGRGTVTATLTAVGPDSTTVIGLSLGVWNGSSCQIWKVKDDAPQGFSLDGLVTAVAILCVRVYDPGTLTAPVTFSVDVTHP
jgi:hypothetical protein